MSKRLLLLFLALGTGLTGLFLAPQFMECRVRYKSPSEIDWEYERTELAKVLNKRNRHSESPFRATDFGVYLGSAGFSEVDGTRIFEYQLFTFSVPDRERRMFAEITKCGLGDVGW